MGQTARVIWRQQRSNDHCLALALAHGDYEQNNKLGIQKWNGYGIMEWRTLANGADGLQWHLSNGNRQAIGIVLSNGLQSLVSHNNIIRRWKII